MHIALCFTTSRHRPITIGRWLRLLRKSPKSFVARWALRWYGGCFDHVYTIVPRGVLNVRWDGTHIHDPAVFARSLKRECHCVELEVDSFVLPGEWSSLPKVNLWRNILRFRSGGRVQAWNCVTGALATLNAAGVNINPHTLTPDELFARLLVYQHERQRMA